MDAFDPVFSSFSVRVFLRISAISVPHGDCRERPNLAGPPHRRKQDKAQAKRRAGWGVPAFSNMPETVQYAAGTQGRHSNITVKA